MAGRPTKQGLDFFSMDVGFDSDEKIEVLEAEYGPIAIAVVMVLLSRIYERGYYLEWNDRLAVVQGKRFGIDMNDFVKSCCKWGLFDQEKFDKHAILTSERVQKFYLFATSRRKEVEEIDQDYLLLELDTQDTTNDTEASDNELIPQQSDTNSTQPELMSTEIQLNQIDVDKVQQSKSKRESKDINTPSPPAGARARGEYREDPPKSAEDPDLIDFFASLEGTPEMAAAFFNHFASQGWLKANGMPISAWRPLAHKWITEERFNPGKRSRASPASAAPKPQKELKYPNPNNPW